MTGKSYHAYDGSRTYHRYFRSLRGVDLSSDPAEISRSHFAYLENMWCDPYTLDGVATESFPGYRVFARFGAPVHAIFRHRAEGEDHLVVHAGTRLYRFPERLRDFECTLAALSPLPVTVASRRGCAFSYGESLCLLIGGEYLVIDKSGDVSRLSDGSVSPYVPMTYYNGELYEQRNLLSERVRLGFTADGPYETTTGEEGLLFTVLNEEDKSCSVRIAEKYRGTGKVTVPATVKIGAETYTVKMLARRAFANMPSLVSIDLPATVSVIGAAAFHGDSALRYVNLPTTTGSIGEEAFFGCLSLQGIHIGGAALRVIGKGAFDYCLSLSEVRFCGTEEEYAAITMNGEETLREKTLTLLLENDTPYAEESVTFRYPLRDSVLRVEEVKLADTVLEENFNETAGVLLRYGVIAEGDFLTHVEITCSERTFLTGKALTVLATVSPTHFSQPDAAAHMGLEGRDAFLACTAAVKYDGRIFFTGNEKLPNTVFYTSLDETGRNNPFYVGCLNYFNDGTGSVPNIGLAVTGGLLAVCKSDTGGEGEIFLHAARDSGTDLIPRIYPVTSTLPGTGITGCTAVLEDETLLLGRRGLLALARCDSEGERQLVPRSTAVNLHLLRERTEAGQMAVFEGMLYLLSAGKVYVADPKRRHAYTGGGSEYEWYFLSGIGSYAGDRPLYRYTAYLPEGAEAFGILTADGVGDAATGEIYSVTLPTGECLYYAQTGGCRFAVDTDGERTGGIFFPATTLASTDEALYFGTEEGAVGCFNTDKRGQALYRPVQSDLYVLSETGAEIPLNASFARLFSQNTVTRRTVYQRSADGTLTPIGEKEVYIDGTLAVEVLPLEEHESRYRVHRYYYSYAGHAYPVVCMLAADDGDIPHFAKDTVPRSAVLKMRCAEGSDVSVSVRTDRHPFTVLEEIRATAADAGDADFTAFDFHSDPFASIPLRERERAWCYKQYLFEGRGFRSPFGIYSLTYSYRPVGRIKP